MPHSLNLKPIQRFVVDLRDTGPDIFAVHIIAYFVDVLEQVRKTFTTKEYVAHTTEQRYEHGWE